MADYEAVLCRAPRSIPLVQTKVKERLKPASPLFLAKRKWHMWFVSHSGSVAVHSVWLSLSIHVFIRLLSVWVLEGKDKRSITEWQLDNTTAPESTKMRGVDDHQLSDAFCLRSD